MASKGIGKVGEELISHCPPEAEVFFLVYLSRIGKCDRFDFLS
ncbi:hypothetical protein [Moorena sp. SIO4G3]|nr:hypothetical protein [Moorena sp. SIO4G3]